MTTEDVLDPLVTDDSVTVAQQPSCLACNKAINDGSESSVQCAKCDWWCHVSCSMAKDIFETLAKINRSKRKLVKFGMVTFICQLCCPLLKEKENVSAPTSTPNSATTAMTVFTQTPSLGKPSNINPSTATVSVNTESAPTINKPDVENVNSVGNLQLCYFYKKGKCLHGKSGKKMVNGRQCQYAHPPKCLKYCRFGRDKVNGCQGNCNYFHPTLCRNSVKFRKCFSTECTFAHLNGTERRDKGFKSGINDQSRPGNYPTPNHPIHSTERFDGSNWNRNQSNARRREEFLYHNDDFPPLPSVKEDKIAELSLSIRQIQKSIEFIMQSVQLKDGVNQTRDYSNNQATTRTFPNGFNYGDETQMFSQTIPNQPYNQAIRGASQTIPNHSSNQAKNH